jgi:hypothetical protein
MKQKDTNNFLKDKTEPHNNQCIACLDTAQYMVITKCKHEYCIDCIYEYKYKNSTCAYCCNTLNINVYYQNS